MGPRNGVGIEFSYRPTRLHRLAESILGMEESIHGLRAPTRQNRFLVRNQFRCGIDSWRHLLYEKELKISELSSYYVVCGGRITRQNISSKKTIWQLSAGDEKSIPALKINIPYLVPTQFQDSILPVYPIFPITRQKNIGPGHQDDTVWQKR